MLPRGGTILPSSALPESLAGEARARRKRRRGESEEDEEKTLFNATNATAATAKGAKRANERNRRKQIKTTSSAKSSGTAEEGELEDARRELISQLKSGASQLAVSKIAINERCWGIVQNNSFEGKVHISLANNIIATVKASEISDEFHDALARGEPLPSPLSEAMPIHSFVHCIVIGKVTIPGATSSSSTTAEDRIVLEVSCRASLVNRLLQWKYVGPKSLLWGSIHSLEDHGAVINLVGAPASNASGGGVRGFLPFSKSPSGTGEGMVVGRGLEMIATSHVKNGVITLDATPQALRTTVESRDKKIALASVSLGTLVEYVVEAEWESNLAARVFDAFPATIDTFHNRVEEEDNKHATSNLARVIWVDPASKRLGLSTLPHLLERDGGYTARLREETAGEVVTNLTVTRLTRTGAFLALPAPAFSHVSKWCDEGEVRPKLAVGDTIPRARVTGACLMDGRLHVSLQRSVIEAAVLDVKDVVPGAVLSTCEVVKADPTFGVALKLGPRLTGLVTLLHIGDAARSAPPTAKALEKRFKMGQMCRARVLQVDPSAGKVQLTLKPSLVQAGEGSVITRYSIEDVGKVAIGFVSRVDMFGVIVTFFANVHGLIPAHTLGSAASDPASAYVPGHVIKVRIVTVDPTRARMRLSLNLKPSENEEEDDTKKAKGKGVVLLPTCVVSSKLETEGVGTSPPPGLMLEDPRDPSVRYVLPREHLTDFPSLVDDFFACSSVGGTVKQLLVLGEAMGGGDVDPSAQTSSSSSSRDGKKNAARLVTMKPELARRARLGQLPRSIEQVSPGDAVCGFVRNAVPELGVFVQFGGRLVGLAPPGNLPTNAAKPENFTKGQTVYARVTSVDLAKRRFVLSLKGAEGEAAEEKEEEESEAARYVFAFLAEARRLGSMAMQDATTSKALGGIKPGSAVRGRVARRLEGAGVLIALSDGVEGVLLNEHMEQQSGRTYFPGAELALRVLDVDYARGLVDLSHRSDLIGEASWRGGKSDGDSRRVMEARVELVKSEYAVVSYPGSRDGTLELAYCATRDFNARLWAREISVGMAVTCRVGRVMGENDFSCLVLNVDEEIAEERQHEERRSRARSGSLSEWLQSPSAGKVVVGAVLTARVSRITGPWVSLDLRGASPPFPNTEGALPRAVARMHACDAEDYPTASGPGSFPDVEKMPSRVGPLARFNVGDLVRVCVAEVDLTSDPRKAFVYLSTRASLVEEGTEEKKNKRRGGEEECTTWETVEASLRPGAIVGAHVEGVTESHDGLWISLSRHVRAQCFCTDVGTKDERALELLFNGEVLAKSVFPPGTPVRAKIISLDARKRRMAVSLVW